MLVKETILERREHLLVGERRADLETPVSIFMKLRPMGANVLLESAQEGRYWGRYSFIAFGEPCFTFEEADWRAWDEVRRFLRDHHSMSLIDLPPFQGGLVGHVSYDAVTHMEPVPLPPEGLIPVPQMALLKVNNLLVLDNLKGCLFYVSRDPLGESWAKEVEAILSTPLEPASQGDSSSLEAQLTSTFTPQAYMEAVERTVEYIRAGDAIQVVLAQILTIPSPVEPFSLYRSLRHVNPSPYMFFLDMGAYQLVGSSPEVMVRLTGRLVETRPIAGTRPKTGDPAGDQAAVEELLSDEKEAAEHVMLVDLARNDLGRVSEIGTVEVTEFRKVEAYSHVFHLVSHVKGRLREGLDAIDVIRATFPAGTLSGAPKVRAMQIISELEPVKRGFYGGTVGYLDYGGNMDTCIAIRSLIHKDGKYYLGVGAGIVADSLPEREYAETISKAKGMLSALGIVP